MADALNNHASRLIDEWERRRLGEEMFRGSQLRTAGAQKTSNTDPKNNARRGWGKLRTVLGAKRANRRPSIFWGVVPDRPISSRRPIFRTKQERLDEASTKEASTQRFDGTATQSQESRKRGDTARRVTKSVTRSLTALSPFLPELQKGELLKAPTVHPGVNKRFGAVMVVDITGFTRLTESLSLRGTHGVELLTKCMNSYFEEVINVVVSFGGDVIKFAGDSLVVAFVETELSQGDRLKMVTGRAVACGMELTTRLGEMRMLPNGNVISAAGLTGNGKRVGKLWWSPQPKGGDGGCSAKALAAKVFKSLARRSQNERTESPTSPGSFTAFSPRGPQGIQSSSPKIGAYRQGTGQMNVWSEEFTLSVKVLIGAGEVCIFNVGGEMEDTHEDERIPRWEFFIGDAPHKFIDAHGRRPPVKQIAEVEKHANPGDVVVSKEVIEIAQHLMTWSPLEDGTGRVHTVDKRLQDLKSSAPSISHASLALLPRCSQATSVETMRMYVPDCVRQRIEAGHQDFINEMRNLTVLFIGFPELSTPRSVDDVETEVGEVQACILACQRAMNEFDGSLLQMRCDEKGFLAVCAFGLVGRSHMQQGARGIQAALRIRELACEAGNKTAIGVATGELFCACVGSRSRTEFTVFGDSINSSARLMCKAKAGVGDIICDQETFHRARGKADFISLEPMEMKGRREPFQAYRVGPLSRVTRERHQTSSTLLHAPLVGRQEVIDRIMFSLGHLIDSPGHIILIEGEPGMGKTKIVRELERNYFGCASDEWGRIREHAHMFSGAGSAAQKSRSLFPWRQVLEELFLVEKQVGREGRMPPMALLIEEKIEYYEEYWRHVLADALELPLESMPSCSPTTLDQRPSTVANWSTTASVVSVYGSETDYATSSDTVTLCTSGSQGDLSDVTAGPAGDDLSPVPEIAETTSDSDGSPSECIDADSQLPCPSQISAEIAGAAGEIIPGTKKPPPLELVSTSWGTDIQGGAQSDRSVHSYSPDSYLTARQETCPGSAACDTSRWRREDIENVLVEVFRCFVECYGRCVVLLEDLHHFDVASWSLLEALDGAVAPSGLLMIGTMRPHEGSLAQSARGKQSVHRSVMKTSASIWGHGSTLRLSLPPMGPTETQELMEIVAEGEHIPADVVTAVQEKSGGVPIYIQQLTQYLLETSLLSGDGASVGQKLNSEATIANFIRDTVNIHQLLMDQIDGLSPSAHLTLKVASVIGIEISAEVITAIYPCNTFQCDVEMDMVELEGVGFISRSKKNSHRSQWWQFNNHVAREAVYGLIPNEQRQQLHAKCAQVMEKNHKHNESLVAYNWERSCKGVEAAEWRRTLKAISWWHRAGVRSRNYGGLSCALECFQRAVDLQETLTQFYAYNHEPIHGEVTKLLAMSAEITPATPRSPGSPTDFAPLTERSTTANLPYIGVPERVRLHRWMAELELELALLDSTPGMAPQLAEAHRHVMIGLHILGAPCSEELAAQRKGQNGLWAKMKRGLRIGRSAWRMVRQLVPGSSSKGQSWAPHSPRRRRVSMAPYMLRKSGGQRKITEEELLEAAQIMDLFVSIAVASKSKYDVAHCMDLVEFFAKDNIAHSYFAGVAERIGTEGREVLLPRLLSERSTRGSRTGSPPSAAVFEVSSFGSVDDLSGARDP